MSILLVGVTETFAVVASDSFMSGEKSRHHFPKIMECPNNICAFAVGNAGIGVTFFKSLKNGISVLKNNFCWDDGIGITQAVAEYVKRDPVFSSSYAGIGICGIKGPIPTYYRMGIDCSANQTVDELVTTRGAFQYHLFSPSDLQSQICESIFITNTLRIADNSHLGKQTENSLLSHNDVIAAFERTVCTLSPASQVIDDDVQYWAYDCTMQKRNSRIFELW